MEKELLLLFIMIKPHQLDSHHDLHITLNEKKKFIYLVSLISPLIALI